MSCCRKRRIFFLQQGSYCRNEFATRALLQENRKGGTDGSSHSTRRLMRRRERLWIIRRIAHSCLLPSRLATRRTRGHINRSSLPYPNIHSFFRSLSHPLPLSLHPCLFPWISSPPPLKQARCCIPTPSTVVTGVVARS